MNKLIIVRHGQSEQHLKDITGGWSNVSLTEKGFLEAKKTGKKLRELLNDCFLFYSSDLLRAQQTAKEIGHHIGIQPIFYQELRELNNGDAAGLTREEAKKIQLQPTKPTLDWIPYPNAESWRMMRTRIHHFLNSHIITEKDYLLISHGNAIIEIINWYLRIPVNDITTHSYDIDTCSITFLYTNKWQERTINRLNDISHL